MAEVISLKEARERRRPVPSFDAVLQRFFDALDLLDGVEGGQAARRAVYEGCEMLLTREEGRAVWPTK